MLRVMNTDLLQFVESKNRLKSTSILELNGVLFSLFNFFLRENKVGNKREKYNIQKATNNRKPKISTGNCRICKGLYSHKNNIFFYILKPSW